MPETETAQGRVAHNCRARKSRESHADCTLRLASVLARRTSNDLSKVSLACSNRIQEAQIVHCAVQNAVTPTPIIMVLICCSWEAQPLCIFWEDSSLGQSPIGYSFGRRQECADAWPGGNSSLASAAAARSASPTAGSLTLQRSRSCFENHSHVPVFL